MSDSSTFALSDLARLTGAPKRAIEYWAFARVLVALPESDRAGSGKHRQFSKEEAIIACVVKALSDKGLPIGRLTFVADGLRHAYLHIPHLRETVEDAISSTDRVFLTVAQGGTVNLLSERHTGIRDFFEIFKETHEDTPNIDVLFLNGCLAKLRSEWQNL